MHEYLCRRSLLERKGTLDKLLLLSLSIRWCIGEICWLVLYWFWNCSWCWFILVESSCFKSIILFISMASLSSLCSRFRISSILMNPLFTFQSDISIQPCSLFLFNFSIPVLYLLFITGFQFNFLKPCVNEQISFRSSYNNIISGRYDFRTIWRVANSLSGFFNNYCNHWRHTLQLLNRYFVLFFKYDIIHCYNPEDQIIWGFYKNICVALNRTLLLFNFCLFLFTYFYNTLFSLARFPVSLWILVARFLFYAFG